MILYIGNKLTKHGNTPSSVETLGELLGKEFNLRSVSDKKNKIFRFFDMLFTIIKYRKKVLLILIDTYSTSNFYYALACGWLAQQLKIPYIPILHGGNLPDRLEKSKKMANFLFSNAKINIAPSRYLFDIFDKKGFHVEYIPNNIEISNYPFNQRKKIEPKLLYVRAFSKIYNPFMAVKVVKKLISKYPHIELCMVGPDKDNSLKDVIKLAEELKVINNVTFPGKLTKEKWILLSKQYDIFINTTNFDNTPVSVIEAMALGLPVVTTNVGGLPFLIDNQINGFLVEKNNVNEMYERIKQLIEDVDLANKISYNARRKAESFAWESHVKNKWILLISNLTNK